MRSTSSNYQQRLAPLLHAAAEAAGFQVVENYLPLPPDLYTGKPRRWTLDFAIPAAKVYLEIDGFNGFLASVNSLGQVQRARVAGGHRNWAGFHRDREKDHCLTFAGWRGLRYGPKHLKTEAQLLQVVQTFLKLAELVTNATL